MTEIHIDQVFPKGKLYPMIVNFENGYVTQQFTPHGCMVLKNSKNKLKTVATAIGDLVYAGEESSEQDKTFILARNRKTGKVRLIEAGVVNLKPIIESKETPQPELVVTTNLELSRKFGSKKQKKKMEQREKLKVNVETVTEQMQKATNLVTKDEIDLTDYNNTDIDEFYIPPLNRNATTPEDIYKIDEILTKEEYESIHSELDGKEYMEDLVPIIKNIVTKKTLSPKLLVLAVYASSLLKLYNTMVKEISKKSYTPCTHSVTLSEIILKRFLSSSRGHRTRPAPFKDKSLCYAFVFILLISGLKIELKELVEASKLTQTTTITKVRVTGAHIVNTLAKKYVQLKLPLNIKSSFRRKSAKF